MTSGYILIVAILVLGGVIAASGDRIGTRVGKARLSLFKLRPRQTATLVTITTGSLIAASTLAILFGASEQLRTGVFDLKKIQNKLATTREELTEVTQEKNEAEEALTAAKQEQANAQKLLDTINASLKAAVARQSRTATQLDRTERQLALVSEQRQALGKEIKQLQQEREELTQQRDQVRAQVNQLNTQVGTLNTEINQLNGRVNQLNAQVNELKSQVSLRDREISRRDQTIVQRDRIIAQRQQLEQQLKQEIVKRENRLADIGTQLQAKERELRQRDTQLQALETQLQAKERELRQRDTQLQALETQLQAKERELQQRDTQLRTLEARLQAGEVELRQRDTQLQALETQVQQRETQLKQRDNQLQVLERQLQEREQGLAYLEQEVGILEQDYQVLRQGRVALLRGQVLASGVVRIVDPTVARHAIDQLLRQANRTAVQDTRPGIEQQDDIVVQIPRQQVDQVMNQIKDGRDYVIRILSAGNYVVGEKQIQVFADVAVNQRIFSAGDTVATTSTEASTISEEELRKRIEWLLAASQFRARRAGIVAEPLVQIGDGRITTLIAFLEQLKQYKQPVDLKAIAVEDIYTGSPLKIKIEASQQGQVIFTT